MTQAAAASDGDTHEHHHLNEQPHWRVRFHPGGILQSIQTPCALLAVVFLIALSGNAVLILLMDSDTCLHISS
ncbi:hypothetical protein LEMLEM_LOCUS26564 [Lemmus lemmus]